MKMLTKLRRAAGLRLRAAACWASALHASAPHGCKCADCQMDNEPCPDCYAAWWKKRHPNVHLIGSPYEMPNAKLRDAGESGVEQH